MEFMELIHTRIKWAMVGARHQINFLQNKSEFEWKATCAIDAFFILFDDISDVVVIIIVH